MHGLSRVFEFLCRQKAEHKPRPDGNNEPETACNYALHDLSVDGYPVRREFMAPDRVYLSLEKSLLWAWISNKRLTKQQI